MPNWLADALYGLAWGGGTLAVLLVASSLARRGRLIVHVTRTPTGFKVRGTPDVAAGRALVVAYCRATGLTPPDSVEPPRRLTDPPRCVALPEGGTFWPDDDHGRVVFTPLRGGR